LIEVSIIIVNYYLAKQIAKYVSLLFEQNVKTEVIIIDNSADKVQQTLLSGLSQKYPLQLVFSPKNLGFGTAANLGVSKAKGKYVFFLNPDAYLPPNTIKKLLSFAQQKNADAVGPKIFLDPAMTIPQPPFYPPTLKTVLLRFLLPKQFSRYWESYSLKFWQTNEPILTPFLSGAAFLIKKELAQFDPRFFLYFEDADLFQTLAKKNKKVYFYPQAKMVHFFDLCPSKQKESFFIQSQQIFYQKHYPALAKCITWLNKHKRSYTKPGAIPLVKLLQQNWSGKTDLAFSPDFIPFVRARLDPKNLPCFVQRNLFRLWAKPVN